VETSWSNLFGSKVATAAESDHDSMSSRSAA
jgi:hypothetical protein